MNEKIENFNDPEIINQLIIYFWSEIDKNTDATKLILTQLTTWIDSIQDENLTMEILKISVEIILIRKWKSFFNNYPIKGQNDKKIRDFFELKSVHFVHQFVFYGIENIIDFILFQATCVSHRTIYCQKK
jgi:hypothetical protein